ncbi:hypothetical protein [Sphingobium lignivorans]|uniref:Uncharacterized protein n=1 Tax=Sphingobium lignivorans TaxID=2735886 RepID=A0ABR6NFB0_9SPHN|nr:hypothetical protein [Sphingobium lignivorans]MBB5985960.1 hypothetical protein [Sphingobium lignivorans]
MDYPTPGQREIAGLVYEVDRLRVRVQDLLEANNRLVEENRTLKASKSTGRSYDEWVKERMKLAASPPISVTVPSTADIEKLIWQLKLKTRGSAEQEGKTAKPAEVSEDMGAKPFKQQSDLTELSKRLAERVAASLKSEEPAPIKWGASIFNTSLRAPNYIHPFVRFRWRWAGQSKWQEPTIGDLDGGFATSFWRYVAEYQLPADHPIYSSHVDD